jgi:hypothetical protein
LLDARLAHGSRKLIFRSNMATPQSSTSSPIGRDTRRIDGPRKVTGLAQYSSDFNFPGMLYAVPVEATIANGKLLTLDTAAAEDAGSTCSLSSRKYRINLSFLRRV